jgi:2Fe-2S ferredoxin
MVSFSIRYRNADIQSIEIPDYINLSLMEVLKAWDYPIAATCRGIAQCATCHVEVIQGLDQLPDAGDREMDTLDLLPDSNYRSRLACQIKVSDALNGCLFEIKGTKSLICGSRTINS